MTSGSFWSATPLLCSLMGSCDFCTVRKAHYEVMKEKLQARRKLEECGVPDVTLIETGVCNDVPRDEVTGIDLDLEVASVQAMPSLPEARHSAAQYRHCMISLAQMVGSPSGQPGIGFLHDAAAEVMVDLISHVGAYIKIAREVERGPNHHEERVMNPMPPGKESGPDNAPETIEDLREQVKYL